MLTFETADAREVRRFRMAQFNGRTAAVTVGNQTIIGHVRSVQELEATAPPRWTITIIPAPAKAASVSRSATTRQHSRIDDLY